MAACTRPARRPSRLRVEPLEDRLVPATLLEVDLFAAVARPAPAFGDLLTTFANPAPTPYDWFGQAVAAGGGRAVVGAPLADPGGVENAGAVYVVDLATGKLAATLTSPAPDRGDQFGAAVAVAGDRLVVGAPTAGPGVGAGAGAAYVFDLRTGALVATLANPTGEAGSWFGSAVAAAGGAVVVGAPTADRGGVTDAGAAYQFDPFTGRLVATFTNPAPQTWGQFGRAVAADGTRAVVGAPFTDAGGKTEAGVVYEFGLGSGAMTRVLANPAPAAFDRFGMVVAVAGGRAVVGAPTTVGGGTAYLFDLTGGALTATLTAPGLGLNDGFGRAVAAGDGLVVVGALYADAGGVEEAGAAYVFDLATGRPVGALAAPVPAAQSGFGLGVAVAGGRAVVAAPTADAGGSVYAFAVSDPPVAPPPPPANTAPVVSVIPDQSVPVGGSTGAIRFVVADAETPAGDLTVTVETTNPDLLPAGSIILGGSGADRTLTITPAAGRSGTAAVILFTRDPQGWPGTMSFTLYVHPPVELTPPDLPAGQVGAAYRRDVAATWPEVGYAYAVSAGGLPPGLTLSSYGTIGGTPLAAGTYRFTVTATSSFTDTGSREYALTVAPAPAPPPAPVTAPAPKPEPNPAPRPVLVSGPADGSAGVLTPGAGGQLLAANPLAGLGAGVRSAVADVDGDGTPDTVTVTGPGTPIRFAVVSGTGNGLVLIPPTAPFAGSEGFAGGGFVAAADLDGDGKAEVVLTPDQGGGPRVTVFALADGTPVVKANFLGIDDAAFRGGARAALGDINKDGTPDLAVAAGFLGGPRTALFDGKTVFGTPARLVNDFFAFPGEDAVTLRNGAFVAAGDLDGDGYAELVFGGGPGGAPRVLALSGKLLAAGDVPGAQAAPVSNFFVAGNTTDRGGVRVGVADADGDGRADLLAGSGEGSAARVRVYLGKTVASSAEPGGAQDLAPFGGAVLPGGVYVGSGERRPVGEVPQ